LGSQPAPAAVGPLQQGWPWLAGVAAAAALLRVVLEAPAWRSPRAPEIVALAREWRREACPGGLAALPLPLRAVAAAGGVAFMLAGTYSAWWEALMVVAVIAALG